MEKEYLLEIMRSNHTLFTFQEILLLWRTTDTDFAKKKLYRYVKAGKLYSVRRGIYAKNKDYDSFELGNKIYTPSYVSFETVLAQAGVNFQFYGQIFLASYLTRELAVGKHRYAYKKIKGEILANTAGIVHERSVARATPERAFLDTLYVHPGYHFDNFSTLGWDTIFKLLPIYRNKRLEREVKSMHKRFQKDT